MVRGFWAEFSLSSRFVRRMDLAAIILATANLPFAIETLLALPPDSIKPREALEKLCLPSKEAGG